MALRVFVCVFVCAAEATFLVLAADYLGFIFAYFVCYYFRAPGMEAGLPRPHSRLSGLWKNR